MCNCKFKKKVLAYLKALDERTKTMSEIVDQIAADTNQAFAEIKASLTDMGSSLDNIAADETNQGNQITALIAQIEAGGTIGADDLDKLAVLRNTAVNVAALVQGMAARAKGIADAVPDPVPAG